MIQKVFEYLAELLMNSTRDVVAPAMKAAAEDLCGPDAEQTFTNDTRDLMGFFVILRKLLGEVCAIEAATKLVANPTTVRHPRFHVPRCLQADTSPPR
jgi:kinetochore protein Nuf2